MDQEKVRKNLSEPYGGALVVAFEDEAHMGRDPESSSELREVSKKVKKNRRVRLSIKCQP